MELWLAKSLTARQPGFVSNYRDLSGQNVSLGDEMPSIMLRPGETALGIYEIVEDELQPPIVVTDFGLYVGFPEGWKTVDYQGILDEHGPASKEEISGVTVDLLEDKQFFIPVRGARRQLRDAFSFLQFLLSVARVVRKRELFE